MHRTATQINDGRASEPVNVSYGREKQNLFVCSPLIQLGYTRTYDGIAQPRQRVILGATIKSQGNVVHRTKMDGRVRTLEPTYGPPTYGPILTLRKDSSQPERRTTWCLAFSCRSSVRGETKGEKQALSTGKPHLCTASLQHKHTAQAYSIPGTSECLHVVL